MAKVSQVDAFLSGLPVVGGAFSARMGAQQANEGQAMIDQLQARRAAGEFKYHTPEEIVQSLNLAKNAFINPMLPGQGTAENKLSGNYSQGIGLAQMYGQSPQDIMAAIVGGGANLNNAYNDISTKAAENQIKNRLGLQQSLSEMAGYKDKEFAYNTWMPYMADRQYAEQLKGAGFQNIAGGGQKSTQDLVSLLGLAMLA